MASRKLGLRPALARMPVSYVMPGALAAAAGQGWQVAADPKGGDDERPERDWREVGCAAPDGPGSLKKTGR